MRQSILERDLELAQQVQRGFLPKRRPKIANYRVHDFYCPADKVGGDYFDYVPLPDGRVAVVVADVVGHGVAASLLMAKLSASVRFCLATESDPAKAVTEMNRTLSEDSLEDRFITMIMVVLRPDRPEMTIVNAGHMPPLICRANGDLLEPGDSERGFPLLFMESVEYQQASVTLNPGDQVILYTDGLNESMNPEQELYGIDRLRAQASLDGTPEQTCARLIEDIRRFAAGAPQADDMCLVCFERH
jgi:serine phosphatase RsbU (regulator of sigma subunit)